MNSKQRAVNTCCTWWGLLTHTDSNSWRQFPRDQWGVSLPSRWSLVHPGRPPSRGSAAAHYLEGTRCRLSSSWLLCIKLQKWQYGQFVRTGDTITVRVCIASKRWVHLEWVLRGHWRGLVLIWRRWVSRRTPRRGHVLCSEGLQCFVRHVKVMINLYLNTVNVFTFL